MCKNMLHELAWRNTAQAAPPGRGMAAMTIPPSVPLLDLSTAHETRSGLHSAKAKR